MDLCKVIYHIDAQCNPQIESMSIVAQHQSVKDASRIL